MGIFAAGLIALVIAAILAVVISCKQERRRNRLGYTIKEMES